MAFMLKDKFAKKTFGWPRVYKLHSVRILPSLGRCGSEAPLSVLRSRTQLCDTLLPGGAHGCDVEGAWMSVDLGRHDSHFLKRRSSFYIARLWLSFTPGFLHDWTHADPKPTMVPPVPGHSSGRLWWPWPMC